MPPSPGFSFGQNWRGERLVVERRGAGPALRGGGSMKSMEGRRCVKVVGSQVRWFIGAGSGYMGDGDILDVVTTMVASFSEPRLCGVAVGLAAFGHA
uniref:Uncharacterized protein n=1 Tax=Oryza barthii TaxID=65489 RepID=A0A0D3F2E7_9ORYZ